jgi:ABC-type antimicrobial peptide transport system permease subunit
MAILNDATTFARKRRSGALTLVAILYCWFGFAFIVSSLLIGLYALRTRNLPVVFGIEMLAGPINNRFGLDATLASTLAWGVVNLLEILAGYWLWQSRRRGGTLGLVLFPLGPIFWLGYAIPIMAVVGPLRLLLIANEWAALR